MRDPALAVDWDHRIGAIQDADVDDLAVETVGASAGGGDRTANRRRPAGPVLETALQIAVLGGRPEVGLGGEAGFAGDVDQVVRYVVRTVD